MAGISIQRLNGPFGARAEGCDLTRPMARNEFLVLARALRDHHILLIEQQKLGGGQYLDFGRLWGEPILFYNASHREAEHPNLIVIHNKESTPADKRNAALHWHVDATYEDPPAATTMLYAVEGPEAGNDTLFADMGAAYDALSSAMRARMDGLVVEHGEGAQELNFEGEKRGGAGYGGLKNSRPLVRHPLVMRHPQADRKVLYAPSGSAWGIEGMAHAEAIALLRELKQHATRPEFVQRAAARTGTVLIWDNYAVMHSATPTLYSDKEGERRYLYRISTRDVVRLD